MDAPAEIIAAGAVVTRKGKEILLVHRPKYDDWSFPKGKLDPDEHIVTTAVREVAEETGLDIRLGPPLSTQRYPVRNGRLATKVVHYWVGRVVGDDDVSSYRPNDEIDEVAWLPIDEARERLTYQHDRDTLAEFERVRKKSHPLVILRHASARSRRSWPGDDRGRTLTEAGQFESQQIVSLLAAYGVGRLLSSSSKRCWTTVAPYAEVADLDMEMTDDLSEEDATRESVSAHVARLLKAKEVVALCTHRPVLPWVFESLALENRELEPGDLVIAHHRNGKVLAVEQHHVTSS